MASVSSKSYPRVEFTEEVMREGMQILPAAISAEDKIELLNLLSRTGLKRIVVGSFVSPKYTPQMANVDDVVRGFTPINGVEYTSLALNQKGHERAAAYAPPLTLPSEGEPLTWAHMCDTFTRRNTNRSQAQEIDSWPSVVDAAVGDGANRAAIGLGAAFGSNFEGLFELDERMTLLRRQHALWTEAGVPVRTLTLADPMGWVTPWAVEAQLAAALEEWPELDRFVLHFHNSRGLALASTYEALRVLDDRHVVHFDTTAGGIAGCPYCGNGRVTGMVATEDLVNMLHEMGIETGVDLNALIRFVWKLEDVIGFPAFGFVSKAGPHPHGDELYDANLPFVETAEEAKHFLLGPSVVEHQVRPWSEPIPAPARRI